MKYDNSGTHCPKVISKSKVFKKLAKVKVTRSKMSVPTERSCHKNNHIKYQSSSTRCSKVISKIKFSKSRSNSKVKVTRSKMLVPMGMSCHKDYSCEISKLLYSWLKIQWQD